MFCSNCGANNPDGVGFCSSCGARLGAAPSQNVPAPEKLDYMDASTYSTASGRTDLKYVVLQVTLKEKFIGTGSGNLSALEAVINDQAAKGYRLHTITTASATSQGFFGGDRIQATLVFEKI